jgi:hypothetical protein
MSNRTSVVTLGHTTSTTDWPGKARLRDCRGARRRSPVEFFGNKIDMEARFQQRQPPTREECQGRAQEVAGCRGSCVVSAEATLATVRCGQGWVAKFYYREVVARYI